MKHTQGPWAHRNGRIYQVDNEHLTIANVARAFDGDYSPANGDLLAAAPDLLAALRGLERLAERYRPVGAPMPDAQKAARAAIAKATGGNS